MKVIPYTRLDGIPTFRDSDIIGFYERILRAGCGYMFMNGQIRSGQDFLSSMKSPNTLMAVVNQGGIGWVNRIEERKAHVHFALFREAWGDSGKIGKAFNTYLLGLKKDGRFMFDLLWGLIPQNNRLAIRYIQKCGGKIAGQLPHGLFDSRTNQSVAASLCYITRDEL